MNLKILVMKIIVKTIIGKILTFECNPNSKISDLKKKIQTKTNIDQEKQNLISNSKKLQNDQKISTIDPKTPILLIPLKKLKQKTKTQKNKQIIEEISKMGFPYQKVKKCLESSFYNKTLAIEYLIKGIPKNLGRKKKYKVTPLEMQKIQQLGSSEILEDLRKFYKQNPDKINLIMENLKKSDENLFEFFSGNFGLFLDILNGGEKKNFSESEIEDFELSEEDSKIVEALKEFGFDEGKCIEAYFICDKNPELTVNYLLDKINI